MQLRRSEKNGGIIKNEETNKMVCKYQNNHLKSKDENITGIMKRKKENGTFSNKRGYRKSK